MKLNQVHHAAIICSDYERSKRFYAEILECQILQENYRKERKSYKLDLALNGEYIIELFSFPNPPARLTQPEACGLRHLAFGVSDIEVTVSELQSKGVNVDEILVDEYTNKRYCFFRDPDDLPLELYEA
jgi:glyoxylase I family protein